MISMIEKIETILTNEECDLDKLSLCSALSKISTSNEASWKQPVSDRNSPDQFNDPGDNVLSSTQNDLPLSLYSRGPFFTMQTFSALVFHIYQLSLHTLAEFEEASQNSQSIAKRLQTTWLTAIKAECDSSRDCRLRIIADLKKQVMDPTLAET